jgi:hypothetical protein
MRSRLINQPYSSLCMAYYPHVEPNLHLPLPHVVVGSDDQGCHNGRFWMKITVRTSTRVCVYPVDAVLPADGFIPSADTAKIRPHGRIQASARTHPSVRTNMACPRGRTHSLPRTLPSPPPSPADAGCCPRGRGHSRKKLIKK